MGSFDFKINGTTFKHPSDFKLERYNVTTLERLANADMSGDLVAKKLKFVLTYDAITAPEMDIILELIDSQALFFDFTYPYQGTSKTVKVYGGSIPQRLHRADTKSLWVWKEVSFSLIQK